MNATRAHSSVFRSHRTRVKLHRNARIGCLRRSGSGSNAEAGVGVASTVISRRADVRLPAEEFAEAACFHSFRHSLLDWLLVPLANITFPIALRATLPHTSIWRHKLLSVTRHGFMYGARTARQHQQAISLHFSTFSFT